MDQLIDQIKKLAAEKFSGIKTIREHLHKHPELSFQEYKTAEYISKILADAGIAHQTGVSGTGIVGTISGRTAGSKVLLLRADMDALPIEEENNVDYRSVNTGVMHACGHDVHSSCLLGALMILNEIRDKWNGTIKFMFQPGEEKLPGGASLMIKKGVLKDPEVSKALAQHVFPSMETGKVGFCKGMYMASTDEIYITVKGKGGHAAMPADYNNPLLIASDLLSTLHNDFMILRKHQQNAEFENVPTVLAFGKIEGNGATNVIPETVAIEGTFRTMHEKWRSVAHELITKTTHEIAKKWGAHIDITIDKGYPFLVNDEKTTETCIKAAQKYLGNENVLELPTRMTAEDFAFISHEVPSCFYRLGTGNKEKNITSGVHTSTFDIDPRALEIGSGLMAWQALEQLGEL